jgi:hypothetical protein
MDVIRALAVRPAGMRYSEIQYDIVKGSATDVILHELTRVGLAEWKDNLYFATPAGKKIASIGQLVAELGAASGGNGAAGAR